MYKISTVLIYRDLRYKRRSKNISESINSGTHVKREQVKL